MERRVEELDLLLSRSKSPSSPPPKIECRFGTPELVDNTWKVFCADPESKILPRNPTKRYVSIDACNKCYERYLDQKTDVKKREPWGQPIQRTKEKRIPPMRMLTDAEIESYRTYNYNKRRKKTNGKN